MQKLGERIRHVRGRMSQEAFAGLLGISKGALGGYERGENCPKADVILTICKKCQINVSWLMSGTGAMQAPEDIAASGPQEGGPGEPAGERSPADEKTACRVVPGQNEKMENDALRAHCRWLQERLDQLEAERRDLNRENRQLWQKNADLGERLARLEQSQELARGHARAAGDDSMAALVHPSAGKLQDGGELGRVPPVPGHPVARHGRRSPLPGSTGPVTHGRPSSGAGRKMREQGLRTGQALPSLSRMRLRVPGSGPGAGVPFAAPAGVSPLLLTGQADIVLCPGKT